MHPGLAHKLMNYQNLAEMQICHGVGCIPRHAQSGKQPELFQTLASALKSEQLDLVRMPQEYRAVFPKKVAGIDWRKTFVSVSSIDKSEASSRV
jgi:hypothetical protein